MNIKKLFVHNGFMKNKHKGMIATDLQLFYGDESHSLFPLILMGFSSTCKSQLARIHKKA